MVLVLRYSNENRSKTKYNNIALKTYLTSKHDRKENRLKFAFCLTANKNKRIDGYIVVQITKKFKINKLEAKAFPLLTLKY